MVNHSINPKPKEDEKIKASAVDATKKKNKEKTKQTQGKTTKNTSEHSTLNSSNQTLEQIDLSLQEEDS